MKTALIAGLLLAALAAVALSLKPTPAPTAHPSPGPRSRVEARFEAAAPRAGDWRRYAVNYEVRSGDETALKLTGTWTRAVAAADEGLAWTVTFVPDAIAPPHLDRTALAQPFRVEAGLDGAVRGVAFAEGLPGEATRALRAVVGLSQRSTGAADRWAVVEQDATGRYRAEYTQRGGEIVRRKTAYEAVVTEDGLVPASEAGAFIVEGETRFTLDAEGRVAAVEATERLGVQPAEGVPAVTVAVRLTLRVQDAGHAPAVAPSARPAQPLTEAVGEITTAPLALQQMDAQLADGMDAEGLMAHLAEIDTLPPAEARRVASRALTRAGAILRLEPDAAASATARLRNPELSPLATAVLTGGLAAASTPEAQRALQALAGDEDPTARVRALQGMQGLRSPDADTVRALQSTVATTEGHEGDAAGLALGSVLNRSEQTGEDAVQVLLDRYASAPTDAARLPVVQAMGNAGGRAVLPALTDALQRPVLAEAAFYSLRFVPGADIDEGLQAALTSGHEAGRMLAVRTALDRDRAAWAPRVAALLDGEVSARLRGFIESMI